MYITAMITYVFLSFSAVQIYIFHIFTCILTVYGSIMNSQLEQFPAGLIAQLVEHCTGIVEVTGLNLVQAGIFFRLLISQLLKLCIKLQ